MNKLKKFFTKKKKSIFSLVLALVLTLSFNYSPISLLARLVDKSSNAYKSSSVQTYYAASDLSTEKNMGKASYPDFLAEFFKGTSNNFNIKNYYDSKFEELFSSSLEKYLLSRVVTDDGTPTGVEYKTHYSQFLSSVDHDTLLGYYNSQKTSNSFKDRDGTKFSSFQDYAEYFVSSSIEYQHDSQTKTLFALHEYTENSHEYLTLFYNGLANSLTSQESVGNFPLEDDESENPTTYRDGVADSTKFYEQSKSYKRVKSYIDGELEKEFAIYTYDHETQNKYLAAIFAQYAPGSQSSYYTGDYEIVNKPKYSYEFSMYDTNKTGGKEVPDVYLLQSVDTTFAAQIGALDFIYNGISVKGIPSLIHDGDYKTDENGNVTQYGSNYTYHQKKPFEFREIQPGEYGYIEGYITYYRYEAIPFEQHKDTSADYVVYVVDNEVSADEQATYDSLYFKVISSTEYTANKNYFVNIPAPNGTASKPGDNDIYLKEISTFNTTSEDQKTRYENLVKAFVKDGKTSLYVKYKNDDNKIIYMDSTKIAAFKVANQDYSFNSNIEPLPAEFESTKDDYLEINGNDTISNEYKNFKGDYTLYFKKIKEVYKELVSVEYETDQYETKNVPNIPLVQHKIADVAFETVSEHDKSRKIYSLAPANATSHPTIPAITTADITPPTTEAEKQSSTYVHNQFVKVEPSVAAKLNEGLSATYEYYYKHKTKTVDKLYIVVNDDVYETEKDNAVYKNLNYEVVQKQHFAPNDYIAVQKTDANYNQNFKLYYKYDFGNTSGEILDSKVYVKNLLTTRVIDGETYYFNAVYIIDDNVDGNNKDTYRELNRNYIPISTAEYEANHNFYYQIPEDDEFGVLTGKYNTLYYKYNSSNQTERVIYVDGKDYDNYVTINKTPENPEDYLASDYELITHDDPNYVEGLDLYYKKIRKAKSVTTYTYDDYSKETTAVISSSSTISLAANSYYALSLYVYTNGSYTDTNNPESVTVEEDMQASIYIEDTKNSIDPIKVEHISTNGEWKQYYVFIKTHNLLTSTVKIHLYMGDEENILGEYSSTCAYAKGSVMFDEIKVTKINETDYNKESIDNKKVQLNTLKEEDGETDVLVDGKVVYIDAYDNEIKVAKFDPNAESEVLVWSGNNGENYTFDQMFELDDKADYFTNTLKFDAAESIDGYTIPSELWQMYISRDVSGQGNTDILKRYQKAYKNGDLVASIVDEESFYDDKSKEEDDEPSIDTDAPTDKDADVPFIKSTFIDNNKVLKLENKNRIFTLGLTSNYFTAEQGQYYRLKVWVYSPDEEAKAELSVYSILKTAATPVYGSMLQTKASVAANMSEYTDKQVNEYGWIPITFYIEGNALHNQDCYLTLSASKDSIIYFDNITIEKITSSIFDTANSDSDSTTYCLSLTPSTSVVSAGVTNGYFNNTTVTENYNGTIDYTTPRTAESWTVNNKSTGVIAGVVPTSTEYFNQTNNFFKQYNAGFDWAAVQGNNLKGNVFAIYAPATVANPLTETGSFTQKNIYSIYSTAITLSASSTYKLSFDFLEGKDFSGSVFANIYTTAVKPENLLSTIKVDAADIVDNNWNTYSYYIATDAASATVYIEIGIKSAAGTAFFRNVSSTTVSKTLDAIRDEMLSDSENVSGSDYDIANKESFKSVKFIDMNAFEFSIHSEEMNGVSNTYENKEFKNDLAPTTTFTTGKTGTAVANFYTSSKSSSYTVTIDKVEYYIKATDNADGSKSYKMYSDSNYTDAVTLLNGKTVTVDGYDKVIVGSEDSTEYDIVETEKTNYVYNFENDVILNNVYIDADELKNEYSDKVLVLANSYSTDYTLATPKYSTTLSKTSYYVVKVYVKTSSFEDGKGLNIDFDSSISRKWTNVDTTDSKYDNLRDENGFVCYQILISTNTNSISSFSAKFSIGTEKAPCEGYAIIAGIELVKFASEKLFNEYSLNYENIDKTSNDTVIKSFFGSTGTTVEGSETEKLEDEEEETTSSIWATFFYVFSSLLLGIVIIIALVAIIIKKHPIKVVKQEQNDHDRSSTFVTETPKVRKTKKKDEENDSTESIDEIKKDDGFV